MAKDQLNVSCELIDLVTILPWDKETIAQVCVAFSFTKKNIFSIITTLPVLNWLNEFINICF